MVRDLQLKDYITLVDLGSLLVGLVCQTYLSISTTIFSMIIAECIMCYAVRDKIKTRHTAQLTMLNGDSRDGIVEHVDFERTHNGYIYPRAVMKMNDGTMRLSGYLTGEPEIGTLCTVYTFEGRSVVVFK